LNILSTTNMSEKHQQRLSKQFPQHRFIYAANPEEGRSALTEADVLVAFGNGIGEETLDEAPRLKWIHVMSAGLETLPFPKLQDRGILLTNVRGIHAIPMAEYTFAAMLHISRRMGELAQAQREKRWAKRLRVTELWDKTLGIVGVGAIGREIARRAKVFGMYTLGVNTDGRSVEGVDETWATHDLKKVLARSDFVVVAVPLIPSTRRLIDREAIDSMKETAYLINVARGPVVDEAALVEALEQKRIAGAVLDVFDEEPLPEDHPFWTMDNVMVTPHISGLSPMYMTRGVDLFIENLSYYTRGEIEKMQNVIDVTRQY
jgi:phosphoglycerate dehydrogenase-like enzyme